MPGTKIGGLRAAARLKAKDPDYYAKLGAKGGRIGRTGGFASRFRGSDGLTGPERARRVGSVGGRLSRRNKKEVK
jgi:general stress protein YciG